LRDNSITLRANFKHYFVSFYRLLIMLIISALLLSACSSESDEQLLNAALDGLVLAIEKRQRGEVRQYLAKGFLAQRKQGQAEAERLMLFYFQQNPTISIYRMQQEVIINNDRAEVSLLVMLTGSSGLLPERGSRYQVDMLWQKQEGVWRLANANWERR